MIVVGGGILGLAVAEEASRRGIQVDVIAGADYPAASRAAAAQLGLKGQSLSRSPLFALKMRGARSYAAWLASWDDGAWQEYYRFGPGRDRVLNAAECDEQMRRVSHHENDPRIGFVGPSLAHVLDRDVDTGAATICYFCEGAVDARVLLTRLEDVLRRRGVRFWSCDVNQRDSLESVIDSIAQLRGRDTGLAAWVLAAGAWSLDVLRAWDGQAPEQLMPQSVRYSWGASVVMAAEALRPLRPGVKPLDLESFVVEGLIDRSNRQIAALTRHRVSLDGHAGDHVFLTSLSVELSAAESGCLTESSARASDAGAMLRSTLSREALFHEAWVRMRALVERHGLETPEQVRLLTGLRARFCPGDLILAEIRCPSVLGNAVNRCRRNARARDTQPRVIFFAGANRSGFVYGPALAPEVVTRLEEAI